MKQLLIILTGIGLLASCVEHRPIRNGLSDESVYLEKASLTSDNPFLAEEDTNNEWLFKVTTVKTSAPNVLADAIFPGLEGDLKQVRFRFQEGSLQVLDGTSIQEDLPDDPNDDLSTQAERVIFEFAGSNVDVKLRESLDGERTNFLEENKEEPWAERQKFKIDFEKTNMEPAGQLLWIYGLYAQFCSQPVSSNLVPDSFEWNAEEQYLTFVLDVTYKINWAGWICTDLLHLYNRDSQTGNVQYRFAFMRRGVTENFEPEVIEEKALVNKKYGAFQRATTFRDHDSGLVGSVNLLHRWNPNRTDPVVYYFHEGFPPKYMPMFKEIEDDTNRVLEEAGASLRFQFRTCIGQTDFEGTDAEMTECKRPKFGDPRYSFVNWHHSIDTTSGLLGYGPSVSDPRTGEIISGTINLYNVGLDRYRFYIQDYLEQHGGLLKPDADKEWEEISCEDGATTAPADDTGRLTSQLFNEMRRVMEIDDETATGTAADFVPVPQQEGFSDNYHRTLSEVRYAYPPWNNFVSRTAKPPMQHMEALEMKQAEFMDSMTSIMDGENPFGAAPLHSREGITAQLKLTEDMHEWRKNHEELKNLRDYLFATKNIYTATDGDAFQAISRGARKCVGGFWESDADYRERIIEAVVYNVAIHEFGHTVSLRHNFYGSVDAKHQREGEISSSVMDYVTSWEESGSRRSWGMYDELAIKWIYGTPEVREKVMQEDALYCTDEHRILSALCRAHDLGVTPAQITLNAIERYDWLYSLRNRRAYRKFWDTSGYIYSVYGALFDIQRMWHLALFDWGGGGVQETLKRLDQVNGATVLTAQEYDEISVDFYNDVSASVGMMIAFYYAIINQPSSFRNYQTEYDPYYGDILRIGIILDKLFSTIAFMDLNYIYYSPNVATYVSMWDAPFGSQNYALSQRALDNMLGSSYDTFSWFKYYALLIFASTANTNQVGSIEAKGRIAIERYENRAELLEIYSPEAIEFATRQDNPQQTFVNDDGEQYVYTYVQDRNWHLVARKSRSPVSYQFMRDFNESLNASASDSNDTYGLKILLAYHEYFNNFVGF